MNSAGVRLAREARDVSGKDVLIAGAFNLMGTRMLSRITELGVWAGLAGLAACLYLLIFARQQSFDVLTQSFGAGDANPTAALFAASLIGIWIFFGHEACGDLAEEVQDASHKVPRAMMLTMAAGGGIDWTIGRSRGLGI